MTPERFRDVLAANLRRAARDKGLALVAVADLAGVSRSHFEDVVACRASPTVDWLVKVCNALAYSPDKLLRQPPKPSATAKKKTKRWTTRRSYRCSEFRSYCSDSNEPRQVRTRSCNESRRSKYGYCPVSTLATGHESTRSRSPLGP